MKHWATSLYYSRILEIHSEWNFGGASLLLTIGYNWMQVACSFEKMDSSWFIMILLAAKMFGKLAHMTCCLQHMRSWHSLRQRDWLLSRLIFVLTHLASMHPEFCLAILIAVTPFSSTLVANICNTIWLLAQWRNMQELPFLVRFYTLTLLHWNCGQFILRAWALALNTCMLSCVVLCLQLQKQTVPMQTSGPKRFSGSQNLPKISQNVYRQFLAFRSIIFLKSEDIWSSIAALSLFCFTGGS